MNSRKKSIYIHKVLFNIVMNKSALKKFLLSKNLTALECGMSIDDVKKLRTYETITMDGKTYTTKDIIKQIESSESCKHCEKYKLEIQALKIRINNQTLPDPPPIQTVLMDYFQKNYVPINKRAYSRRLFFNEMAEHMKNTYGIHLLNPMDKRYRMFLKSIGETSNNYSKLRIRKM